MGSDTRLQQTIADRFPDMSSTDRDRLFQEISAVSAVSDVLADALYTYLDENGSRDQLIRTVNDVRRRLGQFLFLLTSPLEGSE